MQLDHRILQRMGDASLGQRRTNGSHDDRFIGQGIAADDKAADQSIVTRPDQTARADITKLLGYRFKNESGRK